VLLAASAGATSTAKSGGSKLTVDSATPAGTGAWGYSIPTPKGRKFTIKATGHILVCNGDSLRENCPADPDGFAQVCMFGLKCGALIGRFSGGEPFQIGKSKTVVAPKKGVLELGVDDFEASYADNVGSFKVSVKHTDKVTLSGHVYQHVCGGETYKPGRTCQLEVQGARNQEIEVTGKGGTKSVRIRGRDGAYRFKVARGPHTLRLLKGSFATKPAERKVNATHDIENLNFDICHLPKKYKGPKPGCKLVEIDGLVVDHIGAPYAATVTGPGDVTASDEDGHFALFVPPGTTDVTASGNATIPSRRTETTEQVEATKPINRVLLKLEPKLSPIQGTAGEVALQVDGLPTYPDTFTVTIKRTADLADGSCVDHGSVQFERNLGSQQSSAGRQPNRDPVVTVKPDNGLGPACFYPGTYKATLGDPAFLAGTTVDVAP
jgi:hypothetical protein